MAQEFLLITSENGKRKVPLDGERHIIGRSSSSDIRISDSRASRKHAVIERRGDGWHLEDLGSTNGTYMKGKRISASPFRPGDEFVIGNTSFLLASDSVTVRPAAVTSAQGVKGGFPVRLVAGSVLVILVILVLYLVFSSGRQDTARPSATVAVVPVERDSKRGEHVRPEKAVTQGIEAGSMNGRNSGASMEYYRQGLLFYENGNLKKAVEKWDMALAQDRNNRLARKKLAKALRKLDEEVERHYQAGLMHLKYMRFREAEQEFTIVVELSRNQSDRRYLDAIDKLNRLKTR